MKKILFLISLYCCCVLTTRAAPLANLYISNVSISPSTTMTVGNSYTISVTLNNSTATKAITTNNQPFYISLNLSTTPTYNSSTRTYLTDIPVYSINGNSSVTLQTTIVIQTNYPLGSQYLLVGADATGVIAETNESDNNYAKSIIIKNKPNLQTWGISTSTYNTSAGSQVTITYQARNYSNEAAGAFNCGIYLYTSSSLVQHSAINVANESFSSIGAFSYTGSRTLTFTIPSYLSNGTYYLFLFVDDTYLVDESVENDNTEHTSGITISNCTPVTISTHPSGVTVASGNSASFTTYVNGTPPFSYYYYKNGVLDGQLLNTQISGATYTINSTSLSDNNSSIYCYVTNCSGNQYKYTNTATLTVTNPYQPNDPTNLFVQAISSTQINLSWYDNSQNETGFEIYRTTNTNNTPTLIYTTGSNTSFFSDYNVQANTTYYYKIRAINQSTGTVYYSNYTSYASATTFNCSNYVSSSFDAYPTHIISTNTTTLYARTTSAGAIYHWRLINGGYSINLSSYSSSLPVILMTPGSYSVVHWVENSCGNGPQSSLANYITVDQANTLNYSEIQKLPTSVIAPYNATATISDPVNTITGQLEDFKRLLNISTVTGELDFTVYYNGAITSYTGAALGSGWSHSFDYKCYRDGDSIYRIHYPDLHQTYFVTKYNDGNKRYECFPLNKGCFEKLTIDTITGSTTLAFKNQTKLSFDSNGKCVAITDIFSNSIQLNYYADGTLKEVIGVGGRGFYLYYLNGYLRTVKRTGGDIVNFDIVNGDLVKIYDVENKPYSYHYNSVHQIDTITKPNGNYQLINVYINGKISTQYDGVLAPTTFTYDTTNNRTIVGYIDSSTRVIKYNNVYAVIQETDEENYSDSTEYDVNFIPQKHFDRNGIPQTFICDTVGNITNNIKPHSRTSQQTYNQFNQPLQSIGANEDTTTNTYINGALYKTQFPDGATNIINSNTQGLTTSHIDAKGNKIDSVIYNIFGDPIIISSPFNSVSTQFDSTGKTTVTTDNSTNATDSIFYNKWGLKIKHTNALGNAEYWFYDDNGNDTLYINFKGQKFRKVYDNLDRLVEEFGPMGLHNKHVFDLRGFKIYTINSNNDTLRFYRDKRGYLRGLQLNSLPRNYIDVDGEGNAKSITDAEGKIISYTLDSLYQTTKTDFGSVFNNKIEYTKNGLPKKVYNGLNNFKEYVYNKLNNPVTIFDEARDSIVIDRDKNQKLTSITDAEQNTTHTVYDIAGRDSASVDAENNISKVSCNADGTIATIIRANLDSINIKYNLLKQPIEKKFSTGEKYNYSYDANGNNDTIHTPIGTDVINYDSLNQAIFEKDVFGNIFSFEKNALGLTTKITYPNGKVIRTHYNQFNKPDTIYLWNGKIIVNIYDKTGHLISTITPDGVSQNYIRDAAYRVIEKYDIRYIGNTVDTLWRIQILRDKAGDISWYKLTGSQVLQPVEKSFKKNYGYKANNAIVTDGKSTYSSNANAATTTQTSLDTNDTLRYTFKEFDHLDSLKEGNNYQQFLWNGFEKVVAINSNGTQQNLIQNCTGRVAQLLATQDNSTKAITGSYIYGYLGANVYVDSSNNFYYYHNDIFGHTTYLTNDSGVITDKYAYDLWGTENRHIGTNKQLLHAYGLYGAIHLNDSTLILQSRILQTNLGRFISPDRAAFEFKDPMSLHKFIYANNNPLSYYDLTGWGAEQSRFDKWFEANKGAMAKAAENIGVAALWIVAPEAMMIYHIGKGGYELYKGNYEGAIGNFATTVAAGSLQLYFGGYLNGASAAEYGEIKTLTNFNTVKSFFGASDATHSVYQGFDEFGDIKYIGRTERDVSMRFKEHETSASERASLDYKVYKRNLTLNNSRKLEQELINKYGLQSNGGQLINKINSISQKYWPDFGIKVK